MEYSTAEKSKYQQLFDTIKVTPGKVAEVDKSVDKINTSRTRYESVAGPLGIPWYFVGITHHLEGGSNFKKHLHNGDPLTARTVQVPKGRPKAGNPPFTWEVSAEDALKLQKLDKWTDWSMPGVLYQLEAYNGFGYRRKGINSPYLWSYSNHYTKGKYVADGKFDVNAVSKQCGAACIIKRMHERGIIASDVAGNADIVTPVKSISAPITGTASLNIVAPEIPSAKDEQATLKKILSSVVYNPRAVKADVKELQKLLNKMGTKPKLEEDGKAGKNTSDAVKKITGALLKGDPRK